jgi:uncharacterized membrane protein SpoIIM required for sporulation
MEPIDTKLVYRYAATAMVIFFIAVFLGYATGSTNQTGAAQTYQKFKATQEDPLSAQAPPIQAIILIISNAVIGLSIMLTGPISARLLRIWFGSIFILVYNGFILGELCFVIAKSIGLETMILGMLPHVVFELSAVFLCGGLGLFMGYNIIIDQCEEPNYSYSEIYSEMKESIKFYCKMILPIFIIAGLVEIFISQRVISWLIANR